VLVNQVVTLQVTQCQYNGRYSIKLACFQNLYPTRSVKNLFKIRIWSSTLQLLKNFFLFKAPTPWFCKKSIMLKAKKVLSLSFITTYILYAIFFSMGPLLPTYLISVLVKFSFLDLLNSSPIYSNYVFNTN